MRRKPDFKLVSEMPSFARLAGVALAALLTIVSFGLVVSNSAGAKEVTTNQIHMQDAPKWVSVNRVDRVVNHIQTFLEWDIRKIEVYWYHDQAAFEKMHGLGPTALAISRHSDGTMHLGPKVVDANFDRIFGHELVHIISMQKYHDSIPKWLEEGLANYLSKAGHVDYSWLAARPFPKDVRDMVHPYSGTEEHLRYHYAASQALVEMIASKCDLHQLIQLSVGEKMENRIDTYCEIKDLNEAFHKWVKSHAKGV